MVCSRKVAEGAWGVKRTLRVRRTVHQVCVSRNNDAACFCVLQYQELCTFALHGNSQQTNRGEKPTMVSRKARTLITDKQQRLGAEADHAVGGGSAGVLHVQKMQEGLTFWPCLTRQVLSMTCHHFS